MNAKLSKFIESSRAMAMGRTRECSVLFQSLARRLWSVSIWIFERLKRLLRQVQLAGKSDASLAGDLRNTCYFGAGVFSFFLLAGVLWSSTASLSGAVMASGVVGVEGSRKTIQHLEGGIIGEILVKDGDRVSAGDPLIVFDDVRIGARVNQLRNRVRSLAAQEARLRAERASLDAILFDHELLQDREDPEVIATIELQINQFQAREENFASREGILVARRAQLDELAKGLHRQLEGVRKQLRLIQEEAETVRELLDKGFDRRPRLLALLREEAGLMAQDGELMARIARNLEAMGEAELMVLGLKTGHLEEIDGLLSTIQAERVSTEKVYWESTDELDRTSVVSPVDGVIFHLAFQTIGGVVRPGEPILDVVPEEEELIINARLRPQDIDEVHEGMEASVVFPSYAQRYMHRISGEVIFISADSYVSRPDGTSYFMVKIRVDTEDLENQVEGITLMPGLPAEVFVVTAERSFFDYLLKPVSRTYERALRET